MSQHTTKPTIRPVWPAKIQISLYTHSVWLGFPVYPSLDSLEALEGTCNQQRLCSHCANAQAELCLCWLHKSYCRFCHALAHITESFSERACCISHKKVVFLVSVPLTLVLLNILRCHFRSQQIWIYTVCKGRVYPGSAGQELSSKRCKRAKYKADHILYPRLEQTGTHQHFSLSDSH